MNDTKISVVIPVYNVEKYVRKCVESITNQTFEDIEIICINDESSDDSLKILEELQKKDKRIIIINQKNSGASIARNIGLKESKGDYVIFIDSDDWLELTCLEECYNRIIEKDLDIVVFGYVEKFQDDKSGDFIKDLREFNEEDIITNKKYFMSRFKGNVVQACWNKLIKKEILKKNNIKFLENVFLSEDFHFLMSLIKHSNKIGKIDKFFYNYRIEGNNNSYKIKEKNLKDVLTSFLETEKLYLGEKDLVCLIKIIKINGMFNMILQRKYHKFEYYSFFEKEFLREIKQSKDFEIDNIGISRKLIFNFLKIFPYHLSLNFSICILEIWSKLRLEWRKN